MGTLGVRETPGMPWWPADQWTSMKQGKECAMCTDAHLPRNPFSDLVTETPWSFVRLHRNQTRAGYSIVIAKRHVPEIHHLSDEEVCGFWLDVAAVGRVVSDLFAPVKLANLSMGFRVPHVHCHVYPQYEDDDPFRLIDVTHGNVRLDDGAWEKRIADMRARLGRG